MIINACKEKWFWLSLNCIIIASFIIIEYKAIGIKRAHASTSPWSISIIPIHSILRKSFQILLQTILESDSIPFWRDAHHLGKPSSTFHNQTCCPHGSNISCWNPGQESAEKISFHHLLILTFLVCLENLFLIMNRNQGLVKSWFCYLH